MESQATRASVFEYLTINKMCPLTLGIATTCRVACLACPRNVHRYRVNRSMECPIEANSG